jgi:hypothetical protein
MQPSLERGERRIWGVEGEAELGARREALASFALYPLRSTLWFT